MSNVVTCPAEGCDYSGPRTSVGGHYQAKTTGDHDGGRQRCMDRLETAASESSASAEPSPASEPDGHSGQSEPSESKGELKFPKNPDGGDSGSKSSDEPDTSAGGDDVVCPGCGGSENLYTADAVVRSPLTQKMNQEHVQLLKESDAMCLNCGGVFDT